MSTRTGGARPDYPLDCREKWRRPLDQAIGGIIEGVHFIRGAWRPLSALARSSTKRGMQAET